MGLVTVSASPGHSNSDLGALPPPVLLPPTPLPQGIEPATGLPDARLRLSYLNQHRELALGTLLILALAARLFGAPVSYLVLAGLGVWFAASRGLVAAVARTHQDRTLHQVEFGYFVLELALITLVARYAGAVAWLALLFYVVTVLFASVILPRRAALALDVLAAAAFAGLVAMEIWRPLGAGVGLQAVPDLRSPASLAFLAAGALGGCALIGMTLAQFSHMIYRQAAALHTANRDLNATGRELRLHKDHLEELVRQRTADLLRTGDELRRANHELRRMNHLKNSFLANVSHELRTPLTSIRSFSEILINYPDEDLATRREFLDIIVTEADRLTRLINDVLDMAKIEAGKMEWHSGPVQIHEMARQALEMFQLAAAQQGVALINELPAHLPPVQGDPDRLVQVLTNLLSNALKFTGRGTIRVGALPPPPPHSYPNTGEVTLYVADTGCGIAPSELERVFEKFHQISDGLADKPPGSGLGLAICREILRHHGGRIWAESRPGEGSTFYFSLPIGTNEIAFVARPA